MLEHGTTLNEHFSAIVGMLAEKTVDSYDMRMVTEIARFESFLVRKGITYTKTVTYQGVMPISTFRLEE